LALPSEELKSEARNQKSETNPNDQMQNSKRFEHLNLELFFVSNFDIRISNFTKALKKLMPSGLRPKTAPLNPDIYF